MNFSSDISLWWLIPALGFAIGISVWLYAQKENGWVSELSKKWRIALIGLRSFSIFLVILLLFGIIFQAFIYKKEKPILIIGLDDSVSMLNYSDSSTVQALSEKIIASTKEQLGDKFDVVSYTYSGIPSFITESVSFKATSTDLASAINQTRNEFYNRNLAGILLISDGNFNTGVSPIYAAEKLTNSSIYSLGVGDTITKRDQLIKHITHNDVAFLNNDFPVAIDIEGIKMGKTESEVTIESNGKKIASQTIHYKDGVSDYEQLNFVLNATSPGIHRYTVKLTHKQNEYNYQNNEQLFYIEVIDSRSKVLLLSAAPHPDMAALKSVWDKDQNLEVQFKLLSDWDRDLKNVDLIVWHEPGIPTSAENKQAIMNTTVSKLFIVGSQSNASDIRQLKIGAEIPSGSNLDDYEGSLNSGFNLFESSTDLQRAFNYYPPLKAKFGNLKIPNNASVLTYQRIGPVTKKEAQIYFATAQNNNGNTYKYGFIYGEGVWRWKLTEYGRTQATNSFDELFSKVGQYLLVKQNTDPFRVTFPKSFTEVDNITIDATVLNASLEPITTSDVYFSLWNESGNESKLQFGATNNAYKLNLGILKAGKYTWKAFTSVNGKRHEKKGEFIVKPSYLEQAENNANHTILKQLASSTGGVFNVATDFQKTITTIQNREDFTSISYQESSFDDLIEYFILFIILSVTLFAEWFLRRFLGSY
ncbi:MAG: VWA domain-containing protein [Crocinitomicaceae bacterium]|nr:VWA domain-containing protein [Crocinitomicaceae bacterium]